MASKMNGVNSEEITVEKSQFSPIDESNERVQTQPSESIPNHGKWQTKYPPRIQKRRCGVFFIKTIMEDHQTIRILQILDYPVDFSMHPDFVKSMNIHREAVYGEEGRLYITQDIPIPEENPEIVVHFAYIHTLDGKISGRKVFNKSEARIFLERLRKEIRAYREQRYASSNGEFGTNVFPDAIKKAIHQQDKKFSTN